MDMAKQTWQQLLQLDPNNADALGGLARAAKEEGNTGLANSYLEMLRAVQATPSATQAAPPATQAPPSSTQALLDKAYGFEARGRIGPGGADLEAGAAGGPEQSGRAGRACARGQAGGQHGAGQQLFGAAAGSPGERPEARRRGGDERAAEAVGATGAGGQAGRGREVCGGDGDLPADFRRHPSAGRVGAGVLRDGVGDRRRPAALHRGLAGAGEQVSQRPAVPDCAGTHSDLQPEDARAGAEVPGALSAGPAGGRGAAPVAAVGLVGPGLRRGDPRLSGEASRPTACRGIAIGGGGAAPVECECGCGQCQRRRPDQRRPPRILRPRHRRRLRFQRRPLHKRGLLDKHRPPCQRRPS